MAQAAEAHDDVIKAKPCSQSQHEEVMTQSTQGTQLLAYSPQQNLAWADLVFLQPFPEGVRQISWNLGPDKDKYSIGRGDMCDILIPNLALSKLHCYIGVDHGNKCIYLEDKSANGTTVEKGGYKTAIRNACCPIQDGMRIIFVQGSRSKGRPPVACRIHFCQDLQITDEVKSRDDIVRDLGAGAFGHVRLGVEFESGHSYAIKTINKEKWERVTAFSKSIQLTDEFHIMQQLDHPHVCKLHSVIDSPEDLHLVLDFCAGGDMLDHLQKHGPYSESKCRRLFMQITSAVGYLHDLGIVHRDLKPENILLTDHTSEHIKISDFGTSRFVDMTCCMSKVGTASYGAPEVVLGPHPYNAKRADIWSMGVILYVMLSRKKITDDPHDLWRLSQFNMIPFPLEQWSKRSADVIRLICEMLAYDPSLRCTIERINQHPWICRGAKKRKSMKKSNSQQERKTEEIRAPVLTDQSRNDTIVSQRGRKSRKRPREDRDACEDHVAKRQRSEPFGNGRTGTISKSLTT